MDRDTTDANHRALLRYIARGDAGAFEELYRETSRSIYFYVFRLLQNKESAEDVQVEVFTQVWKSADRFQGKSKVTTWLFGIARNLALNELRKKKYSDTAELPESIEDENSTSGYESFENNQLVQLALERLPVKQREVMDLVFFHDLNYKEVAEVLDIPENTVKTRVSHAKAVLKNKLLTMKGHGYGK